jgi:hypothetical protein
VSPSRERVESSDRSMGLACTQSRCCLVYDILDAGPRRRYQVGPLIVHNCTRPVAPGEPPPDYICTNRNLFRHCYLLEGLLPSSVIAAATAAFGGPGTRGGYRAMGLECVARFKSAEVKCSDGCVALLYSLVSVDDGRAREWACLVHPASHHPVWAERKHGMKSDGTRDWGRWHRATPPPDLRGFQSQAPREPSEKMASWWKRSAAGRGLDPEQPLTRKNFAVLPLLFDLGMKFKGAP